MSEKSTLTKATSKSESLRTTVPTGIVSHLKLKEGDKIEWEIKAESNKLFAIMKPEKK